MKHVVFIARMNEWYNEVARLMTMIDDLFNINIYFRFMSIYSIPVSEPYRITYISKKL